MEVMKQKAMHGSYETTGLKQKKPWGYEAEISELPNFCWKPLYSFLLIRGVFGKEARHQQF